MASPYGQFQQEKAPRWLRQPRGAFWLNALGQVKDALAQRAREAVQSRLPARAPPDALSAIGSERSLDRYPVDTDATYRSRLADAWGLWQWGGTAKGVLDELNRAFPSYNNWRLITQQGRIWQRSSGGAISFADSAPRAFAAPNAWNMVQLWWLPTLPWGSTPADTSQEAATCRGILSKWKGGHIIVDRIVLVRSGTGLWGYPGQTWGQALLAWGSATTVTYWTPPS